MYLLKIKPGSRLDYEGGVIGIPSNSGTIVVTREGTEVTNANFEREQSLGFVRAVAKSQEDGLLEVTKDGVEVKPYSTKYFDCDGNHLHVIDLYGTKRLVLQAPDGTNCAIQGGSFVLPGGTSWDDFSGDPNGVLQKSKGSLCTDYMSGQLYVKTTPWSDLHGWVPLAYPYFFQMHNGVSWEAGDNSPEGIVFAPIGSLYSDTVTGDLYRKTTAPEFNTGWVAV